MAPRTIEALYREHGHAVLRRARRILGNEEDAREVLQDVFVSVIDRPDAFRGQSSITTWLYSATTHACLNRLRNQRTRARLLAESCPEPQRSISGTAESITVLRDLLERVPFFANEVVEASVNEVGGELRALHGWDLPMVSAELGLALGGWLLHQSFESRGVAPSRSTPAASLGPLLGLRVDLDAGLSAIAESTLLTLLYAQHDGAGPSSLGPYVAFRQSFGLAKAW